MRDDGFLKRRIRWSGLNLACERKQVETAYEDLGIKVTFRP